MTTADRWRLALTLLGVLAALGPFLDKAFAIDDPLFVWLGRHLLDDPFDFYGFDVHWYSVVEPMHAVTMNPPLVGYYIAAVGGLVGFSEPVLHAAFLLPACAAALGTYRLAQGLCPRPAFATLAGLFTPVFLVSATSIMCDVAMLACFVWSVVWWRRGIERHSMRALVLAGALAAVGALCKYFAFALVPLLAVHGLLARRRPGRWMVPLAIPLLTGVAFELLTRGLYGHGLITGAGSYASSARADPVQSGPARAFAGLVFAGGCLATLLPLAPVALGRVTLGACAGATALAALAFGPAHELLGIDPATLVGDPGRIGLHAWPMAFAGLTLVALALGDLRRQRDPDAALLCLWVLGTLAFATWVNWTNNGRSNLPLAPVVGILVARRLALKQPAASNRPLLASRAAPWAVLPGAALALLVTRADASWANRARNAARDLASTWVRDARTTYFMGHWGFQYYAERGGLVCLDPTRDRLEAGDVVVQPTHNLFVERLPRTHAEPVERTEYPAVPWLHTMADGSGAGFYAADLAPLPFAFGPARPDAYRVWTIERGFGFRVEGR